MTKIVGWYREPPRDTNKFKEAILRDSKAYDVVRSHLYELMPDCTDCLCLRM